MLKRGLGICFLVSVLSCPIAMAGATVIMPFGDSLTAGGYNLADGYHTDSGYRQTLFNLLNSEHKNFHFVGEFQDGAFAENHHEGHSGKRIDEISAGAEGWVNAVHPDIVMLLIGTNDCIQNFDLTNAMDRMNTLVENIRLGAPDVTIYIATTIPNGTADVQARVLDYNADLTAWVQAKALTDSKIHFVDLYNEANLQITDLIDGVHPTPAGYAELGNVWFNAIHQSIAKENPFEEFEQKLRAFFRLF